MALMRSHQPNYQREKILVKSQRIAGRRNANSQGRRHIGLTCSYLTISCLESGHLPGSPSGVSGATLATVMRADSSWLCVGSSRGDERLGPVDRLMDSERCLAALAAGHSGAGSVDARRWDCSVVGGGTLAWVGLRALTNERLACHFRPHARSTLISLWASQESFPASDAPRGANTGNRQFGQATARSL